MQETANSYTMKVRCSSFFQTLTFAFLSEPKNTSHLTTCSQEKKTTSKNYTTCNITRLRTEEVALASCRLAIILTFSSTVHSLSYQVSRGRRETTQLHLSPTGANQPLQYNSYAQLCLPTQQKHLGYFDHILGCLSCISVTRNATKYVFLKVDC